MAISHLDIESLSTDERIRLAEDLWDSLEPAELSLTSAQEEELDRRVADYREDRDPGQPWREALDEIRKGGG